MKFPFKNTDMVECKVLRTTVIAKQDVRVGAIVKVDGWIAKQLMSGASPALESVEGKAPEPIVDREREIIIENPDPVSAPVVETPPVSRKKAARKKPEGDED